MPFLQNFVFEYVFGAADKGSLTGTAYFFRERVARIVAYTNWGTRSFFILRCNFCTVMMLQKRILEGKIEFGSSSVI